MSVSEEKEGAPRQPLNQSFLELNLEGGRGLDLDLRTEMSYSGALGKESRDSEDLLSFPSSTLRPWQGPDGLSSLVLARPRVQKKDPGSVLDQNKGQQWQHHSLSSPGFPVLAKVGGSRFIL